jgi:hypothetical protein
MTYERGPSITLLELWERQSSKGNQYFSGFWGGLQVALLRDGERPHPTRPDETVVVWKLVASERQPRDAAQKPPARPPEREEAPGPPAAAATSGDGARPGASQAPQRRFRREGKAAQRERVSAAIASSYGLEADPDDPLPF